MGAHRTTECQRCDWTFKGSKRDGDQAYGVHIVEAHPQVVDALNHVAPSEETVSAMASTVERQHGHLCPSAQAITPLHDGWCDWCGKTPKPVYEWYEPTGLRPFWRRIEAAA